MTSNLGLWPDWTGYEVDLQIEWGGEVEPVEIKSGRMINAEFSQGLTKLTALAGEAEGQAWLVYGGGARAGPRGTLSKIQT